VMMNNLLLLLWRRWGKIALLLLLLPLLIIEMLQTLGNIVHVHVPIPFSPYIAVRFAAVAVAARRRYRAP
jgi:hypothetical protein